MAEIAAKDVKALREQTGAGMMDCKRALSDAGGEVPKAIELLRERGLAKAGKRAGRATGEGAIGVSIQDRAAAIVELGCETDFVAKTDAFQQLVAEIAGVVVSESGISELDRALEAKLTAATATATATGSVSDRIQATISQVGENIELKRVARLEIDGGGGVAGGYVHAGGKLGVIIALKSSSSADSVKALAKDLAMHVAAADPTPVAVDQDGVSEQLIEQERLLLQRQAEQSGKPANVVERIVEGRIGKYLSEICLLKQPFVKDPDHSVAEIVAQVAATAEGEISVAGFTRFKLGEESQS